jgi:thiol-disulfide isomerase/thioredoxin
MTQGQEYLKALGEKAKEEATKAAIENAIRRLGSYSRTIENAKQHLALTGTEAAKLDVEAWVNGDPLTDEDLKGKVVLLDFWAVWCGPCIATFPHLIEWDQKYDDLVIIGVTNYYNYAWNAETKRATRGKEKDGVAPEVEQEMLVEFAKQHKLTHRFALQSERKLSLHYAVMGIPQAVLIDKTGKVRLIRVGSGEANAHEIQEMIEKLIDE